ncbi:MAG: copper resistance protein CopC [Gemmatimonadota bacterium]|jgi:methionine-rich copper-binding protein CopC|nr:copper resistance protein CopC [Gemmatimonadota bacterium]
MNRKRVAWALLLLVPLLTAVAAPELSAERNKVVHITIEKSMPSDGSRVSGVSEVRLFFTGAPLLRGASVRIVTANRTLVRSSPPAADGRDPRQLFTTLEAALAPGVYVVQWRCIADDGHVMRGDFRFEVTGD